MFGASRYKRLKDQGLISTDSQAKAVKASLWVASKFGATAAPKWLTNVFAYFIAPINESTLVFDKDFFALGHKGENKSWYRAWALGLTGLGLVTAIPVSYFMVSLLQQPGH